MANLFFKFRVSTGRGLFAYILIVPYLMIGWCVLCAGAISMGEWGRIPSCIVAPFFGFIIFLPFILINAVAVYFLCWVVGFLQWPIRFIMLMDSLLVMALLDNLLLAMKLDGFTGWLAWLAPTVASAGMLRLEKLDADFE